LRDQKLKFSFIIIIPVVALYLIWVFATYVLEGRIYLLQRPDPIGRFAYAIVANMLIGTVIAIWLLRPSIKSRFNTLKQLGFCPIKRTLKVVAIAAVIGFILFVVQRPASLNPVVIMNVFAQTLPTSIAEVLVCWSLLGVTMESIAKRRRRKIRSNNNYKNSGKIIAAAIVGVGAAASTLVFGVYHFAHSPPFNQPSMVLLLMYPGILTSIVYFIGRDIYAAVIFHNSQALFGVMAGINIELFSRPVYPIMVLGIVSMLVLIISDIFLIRRMKISNPVTSAAVSE
jgi:hypothetical protein